MNAACVSHITWQLYQIGHVTSIVFHCFQGHPHHLAQLTSLWRHDFSPDTQSATDRRSIFRNLFRPLFNETVFYGVFDVVLRFVLLEQTKLLDAEFKYLIIFSIWVNSTLLNWNKIILRLINTINMREKYSFIGCHWIYGHSTLGVSKSWKPSASLGFYMILIPLGWNGRIFNGSLWKSLIVSLSCISVLVFATLRRAWFGWLVVV